MAAIDNNSKLKKLIIQNEIGLIHIKNNMDA